MAGSRPIPVKMPATAEAKEALCQMVSWAGVPGAASRLMAKLTFYQHLRCINLRVSSQKGWSNTNRPVSYKFHSPPYPQF